LSDQLVQRTTTSVQNQQVVLHFGRSLGSLFLESPKTFGVEARSLQRLRMCSPRSISSSDSPGHRWVQRDALQAGIHFVNFSASDVQLRHHAVLRKQWDLYCAALQHAFEVVAGKLFE
jgi:hypothetical protein